MPQMMNCATEVCQAGGSEGRRKTKPSSRTEWERGTSPFSWAALARADNKWVNTVLPQDNLIITSSQSFAISYTIFCSNTHLCSTEGKHDSLASRSANAGNVLFASLSLVASAHGKMPFSFFKAKGEAACTLEAENAEQQEFSERTKCISN